MRNKRTEVAFKVEVSSFWGRFAREILRASRQSQRSQSQNKIKLSRQWAQKCQTVEEWSRPIWQNVKCSCMCCNLSPGAFFASIGQKCFSFKWGCWLLASTRGGSHSQSCYISLQLYVTVAYLHEWATAMCSPSKIICGLDWWQAWKSHGCHSAQQHPLSTAVVQQQQAVALSTRCFAGFHCSPFQ